MGRSGPLTNWLIWCHGFDNELLVWQPAHKFAQHTVAVKAIARPPYQHSLLMIGGGMADWCKTIFYNRMLYIFTCS